MAGVIETLQASQWWEAAKRKYAAHLIAHRRNKCQGESLSLAAFASDILAAPAHLRDDLLKIEEPEELELARLQNAPRVRFRQYEQPTPDQMKIGTVTKKKKKKGMKNVDIRAGRRNTRASAKM